MRYEFKINPFPAVRVNANGVWNARSTVYHSKIKALRLLIGSKRDEIIDAMLEDRYSVTFVIPMPDSWSKKKKAEHLEEYHRQTPDLDNLEKALKDCLFYEHPIHNDCEVATAHESKIWGKVGMIIIDTIE